MTRLELWAGFAMGIGGAFVAQAPTIALPETLSILGMVGLVVWTVAQREAALRKEIQGLSERIDARLDGLKDDLHSQAQALALFRQASTIEDARIAREVDNLLAVNRARDCGHRLEDLERWALTKGYHRRGEG